MKFQIPTIQIASDSQPSSTLSHLILVIMYITRIDAAPARHWDPQNDEEWPINILNSINTRTKSLYHGCKHTQFQVTVVVRTYRAYRNIIINSGNQFS